MQEPKGGLRSANAGSSTITTHLATVGGMRPANISAGVGRLDLVGWHMDERLDISRLCTSGGKELPAERPEGPREVRFEGGLRDLARGTMTGCRP